MKKKKYMRIMSLRCFFSKTVQNKNMQKEPANMKGIPTFLVYSPRHELVVEFQEMITKAFFALTEIPLFIECHGTSIIALYDTEN